MEKLTIKPSNVLLPSLTTSTSSSHLGSVVVIGIHGWFPGALLQRVVGAPTGTSHRFAGIYF